jgi:peptide/nickel transport system permease protein
VSGSYLTFAVRRLAAAVLIAALVSAITFVMLHVLRPESFFDPRPLPTQLGDFLWGAFTRFDLGTSYQPPFRPVGDLIRERLPADISLFAGALVFGVVAGVAGGVACALRPRSLRARVLGGLAMLALCAPVYWVGLLTILLFGSGIGRIVQIPIIDTGLYRPFTDNPIAWFSGLLVPWIVAGLPLAAICLRLTTASMLDANDMDFARTALGKGLTPRAVALRHTMPASVSPTLTLAGAYMPLLVGNALLVEQIFNVPGVFRYTPGAVSNGDFPLLQGMVLVGAVLVVIGNLAADLLLARIDPRVRTQ